MSAITARIEKDRSNLNRAAMVKARSKLPGHVQKPKTAMASVEEGTMEDLPAASTEENVQKAAPAAPTTAKPKAKPINLTKEELERRRTLPCRNFAKPGGCKFGDRC